MPLTACSSVPPWVLAACKGKGKASRESGLSRERGCWEPEVSHAPASSSQPTGPEWLPKPAGTLITAEESWLNGSSQVLGHLHLTALDFLPKAPFQELQCFQGGCSPRNHSLVDLIKDLMRAQHPLSLSRSWWCQSVTCCVQLSCPPHVNMVPVARRCGALHAKSTFTNEAELLNNPRMSFG